MTNITQIQQFGEATKQVLADNFYNDAWRSTSYLINVLGKIEGYLESLEEENPDTDWFTAKISVEATTKLINDSYTVPTSDERFEEVKEMYDATVVTWIRDVSDDAMADMVYLGMVCNFVAGMRVHAINRWIEETAPSEQKFEMLKLAKRDEKAVELAVRTIGDVIFADV